jgi:DNA-binding transcriptional MerR regulator/methylmalonyl-CoA mutase cobalamin-binding subunit
MKNDGNLSIRYVSNQTGLKPHTLRTWEKRYSAVVPRRTETNRRIYNSVDIYRLKLIKRAVESGHAISYIASLQNNELADLDLQTTTQSSKTTNEAGRSGANDCTNIVTEALEHVANLDPIALEKVLERAAVNLSRPHLLSRVIQPLFIEIGEQWAAGRMKIINEHMASIVIRSFLLDMVRAVVVAETSPKIVVAAPVGQWHETGALVVALTAAESGWRPLYFGPNLPAEEIAAAVKMTVAKAIALSISHRIEIASIVRELRKLRSYCAHRVQIYVGGYGIAEIMSRVDLIGVRCIENVEKFRAELEAL